MVQKNQEKGDARFPSDYRDLYLKTPIMMHSIDPQGCLLEVSDFWLEVLGYRREEVIGHKLSSYLSTHSGRLVENQFLPKFLQTGVINNVPYQMIKKNGEIIEVLVSATSEKDATGNVLRSRAGVIDVTERNRLEKEGYRLAHYDQLTNTPNRYLLRDRLKQSLAQASREGDQVAVLFIDLDRFKSVNDTLGHLAGDELLRNVAQSLSLCARDMDTIGRYGGDEFIAILYGISSEKDPAVFARRFLDSLSIPIKLEGVELMNSASIGIAIYPADGRDIDTLLRNADTAMYAAKKNGCNTFLFYSDELVETAQEKIGLESNLRHALDNKELFLVYQPQFDLNKKKIVGFEALVRWNHPQEGVILPERFIPIAEETGLILPLGEQVLRTACHQARKWQIAGLPTLRMAVNISAQQFMRHDFVKMLESILMDADLEPQNLEIELTETVVMEHIQNSITTLADMKLRNISLAIDDFGTGFSSLVYLKHFPFDRIKIAQEFVRDLSSDMADKAIVEAIILMSQSLNLEVIAEGVENREQLNFLKSRNCLGAQGFYLGRPTDSRHVPDLFFPDFLSKSSAVSNSTQ